MTEKRNYRRYSKSAEAKLIFNKQVFNAKSVNYSFDGIGLVIDNGAAIKKGDIVGLSINKPDFNVKCEVKWTVQDNNDLRLGINIAGTHRGSIKDFLLSDTLLGLQRSMKTGILSFESNQILKKIFIRNGDMIYAVSNMDEDRLIDLLARKNKITAAQFDDSLKYMKKTGMKEGVVLVRLGYLKPDELATVVKRQIEEIILSLFRLEEGIFWFTEGPLPAEEIITLKLSAASLIYRGTKNINNLDLISRSLPSPDSYLSFSEDPYRLFQDIQLDESGKIIVSLMKAGDSVKTIVSKSQLDHTEAFKTIYALLNTGLVSETDTQTAKDQAVVHDDVLNEAPVSDNGDSVRNMILDTHAKHKSIGYYGILGLNDYASDHEIKQAYYKAAKMFHPDKHFHLVDESLKSKLSDIFSYVYEAYATLSVPQKRKEYDALKTNRPSHLMSNHEKARQRFENGKAELKAGKFAEAEFLLGQATYLEPSKGEYHFYYAMALVNMRKPKEAAKSLEKAVRLEPENPSFLAELGFIFLELGYPRRARGLFEKAAHVNPHHARAAAGLTKTAEISS